MNIDFKTIIWQHNMRHVQEHASQLNLMLRQKGVAVEDYITQAKK